MSASVAAPASEPVAKTGMLIRCPVAKVFEALVDPGQTSRFWYAKGSGRLEVGARVSWEWSWYGFTAFAEALEVEPGKRIRFDWMLGPTVLHVEWTLSERAEGTFVESRSWGFKGDTPACVTEQAMDNASGFSFMLAGAKAWLEHGIELQLVRDRHPGAWATAAAAPAASS
jgi:uncharacterized protein YndB with AHSA1/START domain